MQTENKPGGRIVLTIEEYRLMRGISKNKIVLGADVQRTQLQKYCQNRVARDYLQCDLSDLMHYEKD